ncbi:MAG: hypothetical protein WCZ87_00110 [Thiohalobacteraceae bacterium]
MSRSPFQHSYDPQIRTDSRIDQYVEHLCEQGCRAVLGYIEALRAERDLPEFQGLDRTARARLQTELETIMAVYEGRCRL